MFICPIDIPPVPIQVVDNRGEILPPTGEFCGANYDGVPYKCSCTAEEHENNSVNYDVIPIPVVPYWNK